MPALTLFQEPQGTGLGTTPHTRRTGGSVHGVPSFNRGARNRTCLAPLEHHGANPAFTPALVGPCPRAAEAASACHWTWCGGQVIVSCPSGEIDPSSAALSLHLSFFPLRVPQVPHSQAHLHTNTAQAQPSSFISCFQLLCYPTSQWQPQQKTRSPRSTLSSRSHPRRRSPRSGEAAHCMPTSST
jgi:hypothetical protein